MEGAGSGAGSRAGSVQINYKKHADPEHCCQRIDTGPVPVAPAPREVFTNWPLSKPWLTAWANLPRNRGWAISFWNSFLMKFLIWMVDTPWGLAGDLLSWTRACTTISRMFLVAEPGARLLR